LKDFNMFGIRTRLAVSIAVAGLALSGCTSATTNAAATAGAKVGTPTAKAQKATPGSLARQATPGSLAKKATPGSLAKKTTPASKASQESGSPAAVGDVKLGAIRVDAKLGTPSASVTITNHSSKLSNYIVDLSITLANGKTQLDTAMVSAPRVSPGQTVKRAAQFRTTQKLPTGAKLTIVGVARLVA
jgi:uncharacterized protein YceK